MVRKLKNFAHLIEGLLANLWFGFPARKLRVIGVTGTDGKTTTASLLHHILTSAGEHAAMITTVGAAIGGKTYGIGFHVTTPSAFALQGYLRKVVRAGSRFLVLEVTSHGLDQNRSFGIPFEIAVLTNITHEHLDYHKTYERYAKAKARLLTRSKACVLNLDDAKSYAFLEPILKKKLVIRYSLNNEEAECTPRKFPFTTNLEGDFNQQNCLAAIAAARTLGLPDASIRKAVSAFNPPVGRQETVYDAAFKVIIDFAHTPNAFEAILPLLAKQTQGRLIHVFGAAGLRDASKRPAMGEASSRSADVIILTSEDPRTESVARINEQIQSGIHGFNEVSNPSPALIIHDKKILAEIDDRKQAISCAVRSALPGDIVVLTGKGHEQSINYGKGEVPWSEHEAVRDALAHTQLHINKK